MKSCLTQIIAAGALSLSALPAFSQAQSWQTQCSATSRTAPLECSATHTVFVQESGQVLFQLSFDSREGRDGFGLRIRSALGLYLPAGLTIDADGNTVLSVELLRCTAEGCVAASDLTEDQLEQLQQADELGITFAPAPQEQARVPLPGGNLADALTLISE